VLIQFLQGDSIFLTHLEMTYSDKYGIIRYDKYLDVINNIISDKDINFL